MYNQEDNIKVMSRKAGDNKYLHKDFHQSMNLLITYIYNNYGKKKLIDYLKQYAGIYYQLINRDLQKGTIEVLVDYFTDIYNKEEWPVEINNNDNYVEIRQDACPGITHIKGLGGIPCPHYREMYNTVYSTLCDCTPFDYTLVYFNEETGACKQLFTKRKE